MKKTTPQLITEFQHKIIDRTTQQLHNSKSKHYSLMALPDLAQHVEELFNSFLQSLNKNSATPFSKQAEAIAVKGFQDGYGLEEMQLFLNSLSENILQTIYNSIPNNDISGVAANINKIIHKAKDRLSQTYVEQCLRTEEKLLHLKHEFDDFLKSREKGEQK